MASLMEDLADVLLQEDKQYQELIVLSKEKTYYIDENGEMVTGWKEIGRNYCNGAGNDRCASWI